MKKLIITSIQLLIVTSFSSEVFGQWTQINNARIENTSAILPALEKIDSRYLKIDNASNDTASKSFMFLQSGNIATIKNGPIDKGEIQRVINGLENYQIKILPELTGNNEDLSRQIDEYKKELENLKNKSKREEEKIKKINGQIQALNLTLNSAYGLAEGYFKSDYSEKIKYNTTRLDTKNTTINEYLKKIKDLDANISTLQAFHNQLSDKDNSKGKAVLLELSNDLGRIGTDTSTLKQAFTDYQQAFREYHKLESRVSVIKLPANKDWLSDVESKFKKLSITDDDVTGKINSAQGNLATVIKKYEEKEKELKEIMSKVNEKEKKASDYDALVNFNKILDENGSGVPGINVLGNYTYGSNNNIGGFAKWQLFTGLAGLKNVNTFFNLFVPEASTYGFNALFNVGFASSVDKNKEPKKNIGLFTEINFLGKNLKLTDSLNANSFVLHSKLGVEIIFLKNIFSVRGVINNINIGNQFEEIKKYKSGIASNLWFANIGLTAFMNFLSDPNFNLKFDLDIIPVKKELENYIGSDKKMIPQIKIGIIKKI
jgi:predicted  nucleic acid-binding Zn-ribbon protein